MDYNLKPLLDVASISQQFAISSDLLSTYLQLIFYQASFPAFHIEQIPASAAILLLSMGAAARALSHDRRSADATDPSLSIRHFLLVSPEEVDRLRGGAAPDEGQVRAVECHSARSVIVKRLQRAARQRRRIEPVDRAAGC